MEDKSTSDKPLKMMPKPVISFPGRMGKIVKGYTLRVMQWNIDFNSDNVFSRTSHLIEIIGKEKPDVIFMQEVSAVETGPRGSSYHLLKSRLVDTGIYALYADDLIVERHPFYFAITLIRKRILTKLDPEYIRFQRTKMARHLIVLRAGLLTESGEHEVCLLNSHLESLPSGTADRIAQFQEVLKIMRNEPRPSIFGGDTNLRAREIRLGDVRLPEEESVVVPEGEFDVRVSDAWAQAGAESSTKYVLQHKKRSFSWSLRSHSFSATQKAFCTGARLSPQGSHGMLELMTTKSGLGIQDRMLGLTDFSPLRDERQICIAHEPCPTGLLVRRGDRQTSFLLIILDSSRTTT